MNANKVDPKTGINPDYDVVGQIMSYENGDLDKDEALELFSFLVKTGQAWSLQGSYGRAATVLIEAGYLDKEGNILKGVTK